MHLLNRILVLLAMATAISSCSLTKGGGKAEDLFTARWNLISLKSDTVTPASADNIAHLIFYPGQEGRLAGSTGCNRLSGTFTLKGRNQLAFSPLVTTKMACPGHNIESSFLQALEGVTRYSIIGNKLNLYKARELMATFTKGT